MCTKPGDTPPNGGQWYGDWTRSWNSYRGTHYRIAIVSIGQSTEKYEAIGEAPSATCFKLCPDLIDFEHHHQSYSYSEKVGWSIEGSLGGATKDLIKAVSVVLGVGGSYSEETTETETLSIPYPHSKGPPNTFRSFDCNILRKTQIYQLQGIYYFLNSWNGCLVDETFEGGRKELVTEDAGKIKVIRKSIQAGKIRWKDLPCEDWIEPEPTSSSGGFRTVEDRVAWSPDSAPDSMDEWHKYNALTLASMAKKFFNSLELTDRSKNILLAAAKKDTALLEAIEKEYDSLRPELQEYGVGSANWALSHVEIISSMPPSHQEIITSLISDG